MTATEFVALILAAGAIIEVWHRGSLFETLRAYLQAQQDVTDQNSWRGKMLELASCPFCQSYHVPVYFLVFWFGFRWFGGCFAVIADIFLFGLAATRAGNIINGLLPSRLRYIVDTFEDTE